MCFSKNHDELMNYTDLVIGSGIKKSWYTKIILRFNFSEL